MPMLSIKGRGLDHGYSGSGKKHGVGASQYPVL